MMIRSLAALAAVTVFAPASFGGVIALDARVGAGEGRDFASNVQFATMRQTLEDMGHTVVGVTSYDADTLAGVDVLLTREAFRAADQFTQQDADDIAAFNASGGGVGYFADGGFDSNGLIGTNNLVANALGADLVGNAFAPNGLLLTGFVDHPVTAGIDEWGLDFVRRVDALPGSIDLTIDGGQSDLLVARDGVGGAGNAFVMGDVSWLQDGIADFPLSSVDNLAAFGNVVDYLLIPAPNALACFGVVGATALRRRRA
ncbi:MAG: hypothetical protein AAGH64_04535 [Planctomycetota bacterium]